MGDYYIAHHGVKGMKWGVRRYQNPDGSYTPAGRARYLRDGGKGKKFDRMATLEYGAKLYNHRFQYSSGSDKDQRHWRNVNATQVKVANEIKRTPEYKQMVKFENHIDKVAKENGVSPTRVFLTPSSQRLYNKCDNAYMKRKQEIIDSHTDDIAGACLRDMGLQDDSLGRSYLKKSREFKQYMGH